MLDDKKLVKLVKEAVRKKADNITTLAVQEYEGGYLITNSHWIFKINFTHKKTISELEKIFGTQITHGRIDSEKKELAPLGLIEIWERVIEADDKEYFKTAYTIDVGSLKGRIFVDEIGNIFADDMGTLVFNDQWVDVYEGQFFSNRHGLVLGEVAEGVVLGIRVDDHEILKDLHHRFNEGVSQCIHS